jgi:hypothetical protein
MKITQLPRREQIRLLKQSLSTYKSSKEQLVEYVHDFAGSNARLYDECIENDAEVTLRRLFQEYGMERYEDSTAEYQPSAGESSGASDE